MQRSRIAPILCCGLMMSVLALGEVNSNAQSWAGTSSLLVAPWESSPGGEEQAGGNSELRTVAIEEEPSSSPLWEGGIGEGEVSSGVEEKSQENDTSNQSRDGDGVGELHGLVLAMGEISGNL